MYNKCCSWNLYCKLDKLHLQLIENAQSEGFGRKYICKNTQDIEDRFHTGFL